MVSQRVLLRLTEQLITFKIPIIEMNCLTALLLLFLWLYMVKISNQVVSTLCTFKKKKILLKLPNRNSLFHLNPQVE